MNSENRKEFETTDITNDINHLSLKNECNDTGSRWIKNCPNCGVKLFYSCRQSLDTSRRRGCLCRTCSKTGEKNSYFGRVGYWAGKIGPNKGKIVSDEFRTKMSKIVIGRKHTLKSRLKMSVSQIGKNTWTANRIVSDITKHKMRIKRIEDLRSKGIFPGCKFSKNYNPLACEFIEKWGKSNGYNFQHALNGGEVEIDGYFMDGYDKNKNVVFEFDEPHHYRNIKLQQKDKDREKHIIDALHPSAFIRYDEKYNTLYDVINKEIICL